MLDDRSLIGVIDLPSKSAEELRRAYMHGRDLFDKRAFEHFESDPNVIPENLRQYDLVFPKVIQKGLYEGGGADKVTDDSIGVLIWNGSKWEAEWLLAGRQGWGRTGPDYCSPRARLAIQEG